MRSSADEPNPADADEDALFDQLPAFDIIDGELMPRAPGWRSSRR
ncbi:hypothetical protein [Microbacterium pullorum]|nr:hypothetical protein [Microbacterium pullorum]